MSAFRRRAALILFGALLAGCAHHSAPASGTPAKVTVGRAFMAPVADIHSAIGEVEPGASPVVMAPINGRVAGITISSGALITAGEVLAQMEPAGAGPPRVIRAPVNAVVTQVFAHDGADRQAGQRLFGLGGASIREARAPFPVRLRSILAIGQAVLLHSPLSPRSPLTGIIDRLTPSKRTRHGVYAWITLPARAGFTVGSPLRVDVMTGTVNRLLVPRGAVFLRRAGTVVFIVRGRHVQEQPVRTARVHKRGVVIRSGLWPGALVVTRARTHLTDGMRVRIVRHIKG
ncbi:hypothetical protein [Acidiferrobacter sp.]|uniref:efflux RND transporter periplasmic adaptor subunit n=1 Tax=Acidiferrobacter sp. TaxID=1872107 RepID=UPI002618A411|nr:hypothetical protein [Acidiferrobacter sp.]